MARRRSDSLRDRPTRLSVYLPETTAQAFSKAAIDAKSSVTELLERLVMEYLATHTKGKARTR